MKCVDVLYMKPSIDEIPPDVNTDVELATPAWPTEELYDEQLWDLREQREAAAKARGYGLTGLLPY